MDAGAVEIRTARHEDIRALSLIWQELMSWHEQTDDRFALRDDAAARWQTLAHEMIAREDGFLLVAERARELCGFCLGWLAKNPVIYRVAEIGFISEVAVRERDQRQGVGRALMEAARAWFRHRDVSEYQLATALWNQGACAFWQALGGEPFLLRYRFTVDEP